VAGTVTLQNLRERSQRAARARFQSAANKLFVGLVGLPGLQLAPIEATRNDD
jgi:hypothetical protein